MGYPIEPVTHLAIDSWPNSVGSPYGVGLKSVRNNMMLVPLLRQWDTRVVIVVVTDCKIHSSVRLYES